VLTYRAGDPDRPRGHALLFFRDADDPDQVWATYLVVAPIQMDLGKYVPAAFAPQLAGQLNMSGPAAYPLPPMPEKIEGGLAWLERAAAVRGDDLLDGGTLRVSEPWQSMHPVSDIGMQYAEACTSFFASEPADAPPSSYDAPPAYGVPPPSSGARPSSAGAPQPSAGAPTSGPGSFDADDLLLQVMPDRDKVGRLARLTGTLRYAVDGGDQRQVEETVGEMDRVARHLGEKYRLRELIQAARSTDPRGGQLAQLYVERCYKLADEDYAALADLDRRIAALQSA
jgi:hypothetical protein